MKPQLLYVFIKDINRCFYNQDFCFTNDFNIRYDLTDRKLYIDKKRNYYANLWGHRVSNINLIIGKNGSGKTTLFDLVASTRDDRNSLFYNVKESRKSLNKFPEWFAVYHIKDDIFVIEGHNEKLISNINNIPHETSYEYSFVIKYNYENQAAEFYKYIQFYYLENKNYTLNDKLVILYQPSIKEKKWYRKANRNKNEYYFGFPRKYLDIPSMTNLYRFMSKEWKSLENTFTAKSVVCNIETIETLDYYTKSDLAESFDLKLYKGKVEPLYFKNNFRINLKQEKMDDEKIKWTKKQEFIIKFYEGYIIKNWIDTFKSVDQEKLIEIEKCKITIENLDFKENDYISRKKYLEDVVQIICDTATKIYIPNETNYYAQAIIEFIRNVNRIDEKYFSTSTTISIKMRDGFDENINRLLNCYDIYRPSDDMMNDLHNYVSVKFTNLSSGELEFINGFANLYTALDIEKLNHKFISALIFLDEPDESFHPEWSRKYIYYLTTLLNSIEMGREFKYQIIIATHSPFMISDIPKEHITCLKVINKENGEIERMSVKAEFGLMSNFYDIIKNDFFILSPVGEFAKITFKRILHEIDEMKEYDEEKIQQLRGLIMAIGEEFIKAKLLGNLHKKIEKLITFDMTQEHINLLETELRRLKKERDNLD